MERDRTREARLNALTSKHFDFVWRLLRRLGLDRASADDVAQDVFLVAVRRLDAIEPGCERTFLYGTALRALANLQRGRRRRREVADDDALDAAPSTAALPDEHAELARRVGVLDALIQELPEELARVLVLAEIAELEGAEIARLEGLPAGTVASRLRRARKLFREKLAGSLELPRYEDP